MRSEVGVFLDRDGTINTEVDFLSSPEALELIPRAGQAIHELNRLGTRVFVITNQSGIARGFFAEDDLTKVHARLEFLLEKHASQIDKIYYCPHHSTLGRAPYNIECDCRKPNSGMLETARREFGVRLDKSFVVGDRRVDMEAGRKAGTTTILVRTGYGAAEEEDCLAAGCTDFVVGNIYEAVQVIKQSLLS
jgi:D-glycero-D-manno-heptose 1,7-bisphosphate phosphatase